MIIDATREGADVWAHGPAPGRPADCYVSGDVREGRTARAVGTGYALPAAWREPPRLPADTGSTMAAAIAELDRRRRG